MLDRRTTLCLACSSSLPPNVDDSELFMTKCCGRPICPRCLEENPRLARYNPCLACLAGVGVVQASSSARNGPGGKRTAAMGGSGVQPVRVENLDGGMKDRDLFVLGDDEDDDEDDEDEDEDTSVGGEEGGRAYRSATPTPPDVVQTVSPLPETPPPPSPVADSPPEKPSTANTTPTPPTPNEDNHSAKSDAHAVYRLRKGDTLMGIALRFRLDAMELCRLNNLPTTTLSTTPHILHTRTTILLPHTSNPPPEDPMPAGTRRVERAEKRLQMVTKEVDWRVAKAYVAITQDSDPSQASTKKEKSDDHETSRRKVPVSGSERSLRNGVLENDAIDRYLEDTAWEEQERKEGRSPTIQTFPWGSFGQKSGQSPGAQQGSGGFKWPWNA